MAETPTKATISNTTDWQTNGQSSGFASGGISTKTVGSRVEDINFDDLRLYVG